MKVLMDHCNYANPETNRFKHVEMPQPAVFLVNGRFATPSHVFTSCLARWQVYRPPQTPQMPMQSRQPGLGRLHCLIESSSRYWFRKHLRATSPSAPRIRTQWQALCRLSFLSGASTVCRSESNEPLGWYTSYHFQLLFLMFDFARCLMLIIQFNYAPIMRLLLGQSTAAHSLQ